VGLVIFAPEPTAGNSATEGAMFTMNKQVNRTVIHVLHYVSQRRAGIDIIKDVLPVADVIWLRS
jgi:hypothetical protein